MGIYTQPTQFEPNLWSSHRSYVDNNQTGPVKTTYSKLSRIDGDTRWRQLTETIELCWSGAKTGHRNSRRIGLHVAGDLRGLKINVVIPNGLCVSTGSPSRGWDVTVYVLDITQPSLPTLFYFFVFCFCVCFCLYGPFNCISFRKFF